MTTLTIMRILPREVDPMVFNMSMEDPGDASFAGIGGLGEQIRELREVIELPLMNPELFLRVGIKPPKGVLLYGPPGTGKTLLARAVAATLDTNFLKVVSSAIVDKYIGESARLVREMFGYAKEHEPVSRQWAVDQSLVVSCLTDSPQSSLPSCPRRPSSSWTK
jgi:26S proteasome regulatory subunit T4